jgi:hypothetical protein
MGEYVARIYEEVKQRLVRLGRDSEVLDGAQTEVDARARVNVRAQTDG